MIDELLHGEDRGVSPVIGVILMVAITVILAAVIGTFVLNLGGSVQENVQAGANVECNGDGSSDGGAVDVTWTSNQNADSLEVSYSLASTNYNWGNGTNIGSTDVGAALNNVGESVSAEQTSGAGSESIDVTVTAVSGETSTVITTKTCEDV